MDALELWGGHECTLNRVGAAYADQTKRSGHHLRLSDLDMFADLGIRTLRYPLLWEQVCSSRAGPDWSWHDARLARMRELGIRPILGLVHHGAGPPHATLSTEAFATGLAVFASEAAQRYPWVDAWTPVNEPLTTARFSALYGHWYPHARDEKKFWKVLFNQIDGVRLAMNSIRRVTPGAILVQPEDLGRTYSTYAAAHQAAFDNIRRWMTWDLLFGRVTTDHPLWLRLAGMGFADRLATIADAPCPPDILGINHYLTSDRFLDERVQLYPPGARGGNRFMRYADVEAVRVVQPAPPSLQTAIEEAWERYEAPLALTEIHNGCTREEQLRWLNEAWSTAQLMRTRGVKLNAVTAWSLLGTYDWNSLLTRDEGHYEPGVFDVRSPLPRPTALAGLIASLSKGAEAPKGWRGEGWWKRDIRLTYAPVHPCQDVPLSHGAGAQPSQQEPPVLIVGATGTLGRMLARECAWRGISHVIASRRDLDLTDPIQIAQVIDTLRPWAVINAAGYVRVDDAESDEAACQLANTIGVANLARVCTDRDLPFVTFSTDLVFDGEKASPYVESDVARPLNAYGRSKRDAEAAALHSGGRALVIRTAAFFSPHDSYNFASEVLHNLTEGRPVLAADCIVSPTYVPDLVSAVIDLLIDGETGVWHLTNQGACSWANFAREIAEAAGLPTSLVHERSTAHMPWKAKRPRYAALSSERGLILPTLENAIARYVAKVRTTESTREPEISQPELLRDMV